VILNDKQIIELARKGMIIHGFCEKQVRETEGKKIISRGLTSYGYDVCLAGEVKLFTNNNAVLIDPKSLDAGCLVEAKVRSDASGDFVILPPNSYMLGRTVETFQMPRDVLALCLGKSTYARAGIHINVTPIEPGFRGQVVIEISNATPLPAKVYVYEGIAQFVFLQGEPCAISYADRAGKYQDQVGITLPTV
jgi:dCTP deaminase